MNHVKLLDCTLRDGAYLVDKKFGNTTIRGIINGLVKAKINYIEIGFLQDEGFEEGKTVFKNSVDARKFVPKEKGESEFAVLADYSRYSVSNLDTRREDSFDAVRECFFKDERLEALQACRIIKEKGYKLFVQPVDILGYSDMELLEFINLVNEVEPYCLSIVDTFGSMYQEDLHRVFELIHHNLSPQCKIGFHSHNNMQLSNALSQEFIRMTVGKREIVVDGTISGMGRGAGNTPTELVAQYMVSQLGYNYEIDEILDIIDGYMDNIRSRCHWGYTTPYFVAGCYSAHVNNIAYLSQKNSIHYKDIRYILNKIGAVARKRYDYELLEQTYMNYLESDIDDSEAMEQLKKELKEKAVLVLAPGASSTEQTEKILTYIKEARPIIISINFIHPQISSDYLYISNVKRYNYWENDTAFSRQKKIITSNIRSAAQEKSEIVVSFTKLVKCGWEHMDNSALMLLRLLDCLDVKEIAIAGLDGYETFSRSNYASSDLELSNVRENSMELNNEIMGMLSDYMTARKHNIPIRFVTASRFEIVINKCS
ncbi:MAG: hypothetical protein HFI75_07515 [Lachnospiraceae bacterium]|nr:hypothetical protein [Lachnospiraceae bacterium]